MSKYSTYSEKAKLVYDEVRKTVKGKDLVIKQVIAAMIAGGHVLIEDIPGVGKTTMVLAISKAFKLQFNRVQFTPDTMPSDVTGYYAYKKNTGEFEYVKGACLCNVLLADEINRTSSRTQAALLEVMEEGKVTVETTVFETPKPFIVMATQNPLGFTGTQPLPEAQVDRFMIRLTMGYPEMKDEIDIIKLRTGSDESNVSPVADAKDLFDMQVAAKDVYLNDEMYEFIANLVRATRNHPQVETGASPRAGIGVVKMSKAYALMAGRDYCIPQDVFDVFFAVMNHRIKVKGARGSGEEVKVLKSIMTSIKPPSVVK